MGRKCYQKKGWHLWAIGIFLLASAFFINMGIGRYWISPRDVIGCIMECFLGADGGISAECRTIVMEIRFPRTIVGMLAGAALSASGCAFQGMFRNPLVSQGVLGVSSGASFGAALSILLFSSTAYTPFVAFAFGVLAVILSFLTAGLCSGATTIMLVLGGTIISNIFSAMLSLMKYIADPANELASIVFWNMGSLASVQKSQIPFSAGAMLSGIIVLLLAGGTINVLSMGEQEAKSLGLAVFPAKVMVIFGATMATAGAVSITGNIGWVGLLIPHVSRFLIGSDNRKLIPFSMLVGASFLNIVDLLCRTVRGTEIPLGIMTSLIGGPFFIYLLKKFKGGHWK